MDVLGGGPRLYPYPPGGDDGFAGHEGAFVRCCWWTVAAVLKTDRFDRARALAVELDRRLAADARTDQPPIPEKV